MKKEETIRKYADEFLKDKSEAKRAEFWQKDVDKQYACVMAWKRRANQSTESPTLTGAELLKPLRSVNKLIPVSELSGLQIKRMRAVIEEILQSLDNYQDFRRQRMLEELERRKEDLERQIEALKQKD